MYSNNHPGRKIEKIITSLMLIAAMGCASYFTAENGDRYLLDTEYAKDFLKEYKTNKKRILV
jgi:hypothetical protein